jgi:hypothetical protein
MFLYFKNRLQGLEELVEEQFGVWLLMANEFTSIDVFTFFNILLPLVSMIA